MSKYHSYKYPRYDVYKAARITYVDSFNTLEKAKKFCLSKKDPVDYVIHKILGRVY